MFGLSTIKFALTNPSVGKKLLRNKLESAIRAQATYGQTQVSAETAAGKLFEGFLLPVGELTRPLRDHIRRRIAELDKHEYPCKEKPYPLDYSIDSDSSTFLYWLCRFLKPERVLETGVAYGRSSAHILQALHDNNEGRLVSIDGLFRPWQTEEMIGYMIPHELRDRWSLVVGPSYERLEAAMLELGTVDVFIHDSLHTYSNMKWEFATAWPYIKPGGYLIADDVGANNAFSEFC
jgi:predicted O-methyltransferase YrrM